MAGKWFANRGQIGQLLVATLALIVGVVIAWPQLSPHMNVLQLWPIAIVPLAGLFVFRLGLLSRPTEPAPSLVSPPAATLPVVQPEKSNSPTQTPKPIERFGLDDDSLFIEKKTVKLGDYWEVREGISRLKITPVGFKNDEKGRPYVELKMDTGGSVFYGGDMAIESGVNRIALPATSSGFQSEECCAYQFSFSDKHVHFIGVRVDHINGFANEVVLELCAVSIHKGTRFK
jgi:hypothetical protein